MFALDRLIVTSALPVIQRDLGASLPALEWTVSAFTLTFAVLLLAGAALGDRFGRRRMFVVGLALFTAGSAAAALAPSAGAPYPVLVPGLAAIGAGAACLFVPIQATLLGAVEPARQGQASGAAVAFRELGGVLGVAVLASVFSAHGSAASAGAFVDGARPAFLVAAGVAAAAALLALGLRARVANPLRRPLLAD